MNWTAESSMRIQAQALRNPLVRSLLFDCIKGKSMQTSVNEAIEDIKTTVFECFINQHPLGEEEETMRRSLHCLFAQGEESKTFEKRARSDLERHTRVVVPGCVMVNFPCTPKMFAGVREEVVVNSDVHDKCQESWKDIIGIANEINKCEIEICMFRQRKLDIEKKVIKEAYDGEVRPQTITSLAEASKCYKEAMSCRGLNGKTLQGYLDMLNAHEIDIATDFLSLSKELLL